MKPIIQRFCWFDTVGKKGTSRETIWKHKRAIEGHKLVLVDIRMVVESSRADNVHAQIYDGFVYSHWGSFSGIFDQSTLALSALNTYNNNTIHGLNSWECKELTMSVRNTTVEYTFPICLIVYFYEVPMTKEETYEYAVRHPRYKYRHGGSRTLDRFEDIHD
ncbi:unnamed protein product [marine sediment metagenome]|uniref:Uncharacterized protein n=1 Tax=marine sediment metagenome TaxID=412755 RepID=X1GAP9_9ZZZZ